MAENTPAPAANLTEPTFSALTYACWAQNATMFKLLNTKTRKFVGPGKQGRIWKRKGDFVNSLVDTRFAKSVAQDHVLVEMQLDAKHVWPIEPMIKGVQDRAAERERERVQQYRERQDERERQEYERLAKKFANKS